MFAIIYAIISGINEDSANIISNLMQEFAIIPKFQMEVQQIYGIITAKSMTKEKLVMQSRIFKI
jgi:hypothetical protein